jgi:hypothetical protein
LFCCSFEYWKQAFIIPVSPVITSEKTNFFKLF